MVIAIGIEILKRMVAEWPEGHITSEGSLAIGPSCSQSLVLSCLREETLGGAQTIAIEGPGLPRKVMMQSSVADLIR